MYKRRVHILFWHPTDPAKTRLAARLANTIGPDWVEARAMEDPEGAGETFRQWPDLLVQLDRTAPLPLPCAPHTRCKAWPEPEGDWEAGVAGRIHGVIGGLKLLARLDDSHAPDEKKARQAPGLVP